MTHFFSPVRFSSLFLLAAALLSSCAKQVDVAPTTAPAPQAPTIVQHASTGQLDVSAYSASGPAPGVNLNFSWFGPVGQPIGPEVATSVNIEFQVNGIPALRALGQPVTAYTYAGGNTSFLVRYSIPSMLRPDTYTVVITPSDPSKSLTPASSPQTYVTSFTNPLPVSPNPVTVEVDGGPQLLLGGPYSTSFPLHWPSQDLPTTAVRIYMIDSAGLIYDPGQYSQRVTLAPNSYSLTYTDNDGFEQVNISQVPNGRYVFQVGSVDAYLNSPDAYYVSAGGINIYNDVPGGGTAPAPGSGAQ